ncbi:MAG: bifunctional 4-hydroxy-2-oxoglutarate aldolase/2-dehydro-3-deoxy-phosphogluconate aldolase [Bacteroidetes bacterium]|nr:bifunctional 4-hydroxy-2-oxoglutarate aldolase/2-dehydro-3-deoxy-phosphogluconate aldolase [Bacteroidota bacterium]
MTRDEILKTILDNGAVAVVRIDDDSKMEKVARALCDGGVNILEVTMTVPNAIGAIRELTKLNIPDLLVGVGSVTNKTMVEEAIEAGAQFIVSPVTKDEIIRTAHAHGKPVMPGAFTPTEIFRAYEIGADVVKVFPADILGMSFFKSVKAPMPFLNIMPTGGVTLDNAGEWLSAGACAVGVGSALVDKKLINDNNYTELTKNADRLMNSINSFRDTIKRN